MVHRLSFLLPTSSFTTSSPSICCRPAIGSPYARMVTGTQSAYGQGGERLALRMRDSCNELMILAGMKVPHNEALSRYSSAWYRLRAGKVLPPLLHTLKRETLMPSEASSLELTKHHRNILQRGSESSSTPLWLGGRSSSACICSLSFTEAC